MSDIIKLLPDAIANQIAAGEVVQRPCSVVKELLENAIDAGAKNIKLIVKESGKSLIQVIDDGKGMSHTDSRMAFEKHATSKISSSEDLFNIRTKGFRGEALASIAAVAQVELKTKIASNELGTLVQIEASKIIKHEPIATTDGTIFTVKNLFYNVPARRNFLKSNAQEMKLILDEFIRVGLAHPEISFSMFQNDLETLILPSDKLAQRILHVFGNQYKENLAPCIEDTDFVQISGYIGKPTTSKRSRGDQFFFVNNRFIKSSYLHHAVVSGYSSLLQESTHPFYVIYIQIDPKHIDINVHPTKTEIKFDDESTVYGIMASAVRKALTTYNFLPSMDFAENINHDHFYTKSTDRKIENNTQNYTWDKHKTPTQVSNKNNWNQLFSGFENSPQLKHVSHSDDDLKLDFRFESKVNSIENQSENNQIVNKQYSTFNSFQVFNQFIVTQLKSGLVLIDQQAAHECILAEEYYRELQNACGQSQTLLFHQTIDLAPADFVLIESLLDDLHKLGFEIDIFGKNTLLVRAIPSTIVESEVKNIIEELLESFKNNKKDSNLSDGENIARSLAKRTAIKAGKKLENEEISSLIGQLFSCRTPSFAPDGRSTFVILDQEKLQSLLINNLY